MQAFFVPLRELCRKFDAYMHVGIPLATVPQLMLGHTKLIRSADTLRQVMLAAEHHLRRSRDPWSAGNEFTIPAEWVSVMLNLYGVEGNVSYTQVV